MITRCYLEITNRCNLNCIFCPKTERSKHQLTAEEFDILTDKLQGEVKYLYFHLMGEPLLHPLLPQFIRQARAKGFIPVITTNGTLFSKGEELIDAQPHKIQISLHSQEGNGVLEPEKYIEQVMNFAKKAASKGILIILRLWNEGGHDTANEQIINLIAQYQPHPWIQREDGWKLASNLYIEFDRMFEWPDLKHEAYNQEEVFCYALRNQLGVLVDGSVVPCCLDHAGDIVLGNLFAQSLEEILATSRARNLYDGFSRHVAVEPLCQKCGYAMETKQYRK